MSDQVVFTKEEIEKIREALSFADKLNFQVYGGSEPYDSALSLLDSPRPRPKVPMKAILLASEENWIPAMKNIFTSFGFDVED